MQLRLGDVAKKGFASFFLLASSTRPPDAVTVTDGDGRFAFDVAVQEGGRIALGSGDLVWKKKAPRFLGSDVDLDFGELTVHMGAVLRGRVISEHDAPIEGVSLRCLSYEASFRSSRNTKSDKSGKFELRGLPGGRAYLTVTRKGYVGFHQWTELVLGKTRDGMVLRLRRGEMLMGIVVDDQSKPIEGAMISAHGQGRSLTDGGYEYSNGSAKTNKNGEFRVTGLGAGPYQVNARAKGHVTASQSKVQTENGPMRFALIRKGSIVGQLVDERGAPIKDSRVYSTTTQPKDKSQPGALVFELARINIVANAGFAGFSNQRGVKTDAEGKFTLDNIKPGKIWLVANGPHRRAVHGPLQIMAGQNLTDVMMSAKRGGVVIVHVTDPDGLPVVKASVTLRVPKTVGNSPPLSGMALYSVMVHGMFSRGAMVPGSQAANSTRGKTDAGGNCEFAGVDPGHYVVVATHENWVASKPVDVTVPPAEGRIETKVSMTAGGKVALRVLDHLGKAVAEQGFRIYLATAVTGSDKNGKPRKPKSVASGRTDATGRATVGPIAPGAYEAVVELGPSGPGGAIGIMFLGNQLAGNRGKEIGRRVSFQVRANQIVLVSLTRPKLASLSGTVSDASGAIANARLQLAAVRQDRNVGMNVAMLGRTSTKRVRSDANGVYTFEGLPAGRYSISVLRRKGEMLFMKKVEIQGVNDQRKDLFLSVGTVEVLARMDGKPVEGVKLSLSAIRDNASNMLPHMLGGAAAVPTATTDVRGVARFEAIPLGGRYTIRLTGKKYLQPKSDPFELTDGGVTRRDLELRESATLEFSFVAAAGTDKLMMVQVEVKALGSEKPKSHWMNASRPQTQIHAPGRYELRAKRYDMRGPTAQPPSAWSVTKIVEVRRGKATKIEIIVP